MKLMMIAALAVFSAAPVLAQTVCLHHDVIMERLADEYGEARVSVALTQTGAMLEIYANLETGTWSAVATAPGGESCLIGDGTNYEAILPGEGT